MPRRGLTRRCAGGRIRHVCMAEAHSALATAKVVKSLLIRKGEGHFFSANLYGANGRRRWVKGRERVAWSWLGVGLKVRVFKFIYELGFGGGERIGVYLHVRAHIIKWGCQNED